MAASLGVCAALAAAAWWWWRPRTLAFTATDAAARPASATLRLLRYHHTEARVRGFVGRRWWGSDGHPPKERVAGIAIAIAGRTVQLPAAVWNDIGDVTRGRLLIDDGRMQLATLLLRGGDAAGSFEAAIELRHDGSMERRIWPGEFPELGECIEVSADGRVSARRTCVGAAALRWGPP